MQFFQIPSTSKSVNNNMDEVQIISSHGIPMDLFAKALKNIGKNKPNFTMDDIENLVISEDLDIQPLNGLSFYSSKISKAKSSGYLALLEPNQLVSLSNKNTNLQAFIFGNKLHIGSDLESVFEEKQKLLESFSPTEKKLWEWLDSNKSGISSLTLCSYLFPEFPHEKLQKFILDERFSHPHDVEDFSRCLNFVNTVNISTEHLSSLNISTTWNKLIKNWDSISSKILSGDDHQRVEANELIKDSINSISNSPKP